MLLLLLAYSLGPSLGGNRAWEQGLGTGEVVRLRVVCLRVAGLVLGLRLSSFLLLLLAGGELGYIASLAGGVGSGKFNDPRPLLGRGYL